MKGDCNETEQLKYEMLREKLINTKKVGELYDNANRFLSTAIEFIENYSEKIGLQTSKYQKNENLEKLINGKVHNI